MNLSAIVRSLVLLGLMSSTSAAVAQGDPRLQVGKPPAGFPAFYKKHVSVGGFPVVASEKVSDYALLEAGFLINKMLSERPDVIQALTENGVRFAIMAPDEFTTDIPEHSDLTPKKYYDRRARGLGPTKRRPAVSCGEENLLCLKGDPYGTENILIHEFAHAIHLMGLNTTDPNFDARLKATYEAAMREKLWEGKYASRNKEEYWAEGVQSYFDTNRMPDHDHNHVRTRESLEKYDPRLAMLIDETFRKLPWRYVRPDARTDPGHLAGFDRSQAGRFEWPADLKEIDPKARPQSK